jgi:hypothetical protein
MLHSHDIERVKKRIAETPQYLDPRIMDLYWRARNLSDSPAFQYVAFYQVLEFCSSFFPHDTEDKDRKRLQVVVNTSVIPASLRSWLKENEAPNPWLEDLPSPKPSAFKSPISLEQTDEDLLREVSKRISDMRNRLLHSKDSSKTEGIIFPFSSVEWQLGYDLCLIEFVVQEVMLYLGKAQRSLPLR